MESPIRRSKESKKGRFVPELNNMEHVNAQLKGKLKILTIEMKDAVERMNTMTVEMNSIKNENILCKDRLAELEQENALLVSQIEEMANERAERDSIIEEFSTAVEARIVEWKEILDEKDGMISKLKENLMSVASARAGGGSNSPEERSSAEIERLVRDIDRRDEIIAELQSKLAEAVVEINESSLLIEKFRSDSRPQGAPKRAAKEQREMNKKAEDANKKINTLQSLLERAEKDAKIKSEQLCEALAILNKYEDENASLSEALDEIKDLKGQVKKKSQHVEDLVDVVNRLEMENSRYEEIIIILRDKIELTEGEEFTFEDLILQRQKAQEEIVEKMQRHYDELSSENVDLKFQIRKLKAALKESLKSKLSKSNGVVSDGERADDLSHRSESQKEQVELRRIKDSVKWIIEENEALRQGMHEILDSIHDQDGKSLVNIQSQTLENLLDALDARHLAGWYHPAMRLQGRVNYLQGSNAELRAQLQQIRRNQLLQESEAQQRSSSVEEGECRGSRDPGELSMSKRSAEMSTATPSGSRNTSPKSSRSVHSLNADSGRASGRAVESDEVLQEPASPAVAADSPGDTPMNDAEDAEGFGKRSEELYAMAKEMVAQESEFREALSAAERRQRELEARVISLRRSLAGCVPAETHAELRQRHLEASLALRGALEERDAASAENTEINQDQVQRELRAELLGLHQQLVRLLPGGQASTEANAPELERRLGELEAENEALRRSAEIAREEAHRHRAIDSAVLAEFNELRRRVSRLETEQGSPEAKETASLALELANCRLLETELREQKKSLERELARARQELQESRRRRDSDGEIREGTNGRMSANDYMEIIDFLQHQYAGSTSLSACERYEASMNKLNNDRNEIKELINKINDRNESLQIQHETLTSRLQIVEQLKDMLEQQIGSNEVQDIMQRFTNETKKILAESKYKAQVCQLEEEQRQAKKSLVDYEAKLALMEKEVVRAQKAWRVQRSSKATRRPVGVDEATETEVKTEDKLKSRESLTKSTQTDPKNSVSSVESQCALCCRPTVDRPAEGKRDLLETRKDVLDGSESDEESREAAEKVASIALLQEQLGQALSLASERSVALSKTESQLVELRAKVVALTKLHSERLPITIESMLEQPSKDDEDVVTSQEALLSTIKTLEKIAAQKEETIARYQSLLKEDRDKHSEAAARLQDEIKSLKRRVAEGRRDSSSAQQPLDNDLVARTSECPERDLCVGDGGVGVGQRTSQEEETSQILREKISRLETELGISAELAERWHRLAEDRLRHMDSTRERLEEQHREEIESYRKELNKRQQEINELRRQISENRRAPTSKTEVLSFMKDLQIKDNRLAEEIENELEEHAAVASQQLSTTYTIDDTRRLVEIEHSQSQLDNLRKQLQASMERERSYKSEIAELQQQLSRRYLAVKAQEKKASRREMQLERKAKDLEEELHETRDMLERHFALQQAKRAKTAEDLGLWEKLKKWQQTAERLKEKLKDKTDECQRLQVNYEKLRNLIACMERERYFLRERKYPRVVETIPPTPPTIEPPAPTPDHDENEFVIEELRTECQELRRRVKELLTLLTRRDEEAAATAVENRRKATTVVLEGDQCVNAELKRLREVQEMLEKEHLRLEAENFELRLELERANVNLPRYEDKIQHLEKYVELLKTEKSMEPPPRREGPQRTKSELERTVVTLKNLVEKLQQENKRLRSSAMQGELEAQCNCLYLREEYEQAKHRIALLETELELAQRKIALMTEMATVTGADKSEEAGELAILREQLNHKSELLLKVKDLLDKATANEKALRQRIQQLEFKQTLSAIPECGSSLAMT